MLERSKVALINLNIPLFDGLSTSSEIKQELLKRELAEKRLRQYHDNYETLKNIEKDKITLTEKQLKTEERILIKVQSAHKTLLNEFKRGIKDASDLISSSDRILENKRKILNLKKEILILTATYNFTYLEE
jgi:outer membrane protein TolC